MQLRAIYLLCFLVFCGHSSEVGAKADVLVVTGFQDQKLFSAITEKSKKIAKRNRGKFQAIEFSDSKKLPTGEASKQIKTNINNGLANTSPNDSLLLFINDHGVERQDSISPLTTGIYLPGGEVLSYQDLITSISKADGQKKDNPKKLKIIGTHCYAGGAHYISFARKNTCSSALTSQTNVGRINATLNSYANRIVSILGSEDLGADLNQDKKISLYEAHLFTAIGDLYNDGKGQISSMAYVDYVKKKAAFNPSANSDPVNFVDLLEKMQSTETQGLIEERIDVSRLDSVTDGDKDFNVCAHDNVAIGPIANLITQINLITHRMKLKGTQIQPPRLQPYYNGLKKLWNKSRIKLWSHLNQEIQDYKNLKSEYMNLSPHHKRSYLGEYTKKMDHLEEVIRNRMAVLWNIFSLLQNFERADEFYRDPSTKQFERDKFNQLLDCEMEEL